MGSNHVWRRFVRSRIPFARVAEFVYAVRPVMAICAFYGAILLLHFDSRSTYRRTAIVCFIFFLRFLLLSYDVAEMPCLVPHERFPKFGDILSDVHTLF